jgi:hypothetical protein
MKTLAPSLSLDEAAQILGREVKTQHNGFRHIVWSADRHAMEVRMVRTRDNEPEHLAVFGKAAPWAFGSEVRKDRPRDIWVDRPSARYLKSLAVAK